MLEKYKGMCQPFYPVLGRVLLAALFIFAAYEKLMDLINNKGTGIIQLMEYAKIPMAGMTLLILIIAVELLGGLMLVVGYKAKWAACALAIFTLMTTYFFHFEVAQMLMALKNLAIVGGLLYVSAYGAGMYSVDAWCAKRASTPTA